MAERDVVLDETASGSSEPAEKLQQAIKHARQAEAELSQARKELEHAGGSMSGRDHAASATAQEASRDAVSKQPPSPSTAGNEEAIGGGESELRKDSMMAHLLDSLAAGKDIGHYGRLVFAMVARHFLPHDEVLGWLTRDQDFSEEDARLMLRQVEGRDYSPPKRDRILEWQAKQEFPILPNPDDPDCGNLYRNLTFPQEIYSHIGHYQEQKIEAGE